MPLPDNNQDDRKLAAQIKDAMNELDAADATRKEKAVAAGRLLLEAQKRHPTDQAFETFLELAGGVRIRRAKDLIAIALERKDFERHQIENAAAQQRHRDKLKAEKIEREKQKAALPKPKPEPEPKPKGNGKPEQKPALRNADDWSAANLEEFERACVTCLPTLNEADLKRASAYFNKGEWKRKTNKEAAA